MNLSDLAPFLSNNADLSRSRTLPGMLLTFLATKEETGGDFALIEARARRGTDPGPHTHTHENESFFLLAGSIWFKIGDQELTAGPGEFVFLPRGICHQMKILTDTIHALILISPAGFEKYFWQLSQPATGTEIPPLPATPPDAKQVARVTRLNRAYGLKPG